jgi:hypothetical protein
MTSFNDYMKQRCIRASYYRMMTKININNNWMDCSMLSPRKRQNPPTVRAPRIVIIELIKIQILNKVSC